MEKPDKTKETARSVAEAGLVAELAKLGIPDIDIPSDPDEMSSEDWTALNGWMRAVRESKA